MKKREKLIAARLSKGWSQEVLAEKIGVARNTLSTWERSITDPYRVHVQRLCTVCGRVGPDSQVGKCNLFVCTLAVEKGA